MVPKKQKRQLSSVITESIATWKFIFLTLFFCGFELWWNRTTLVPDSWKFDQTMLTLNTALSLWAAIQSSVIMIDARLADGKRDRMMIHMNNILNRLDKLEKERKNNNV